MPFTEDQFLEFFRSYNMAIWPMQIIGYILGVIAVVLAFWKLRGSNRIISGILGFMWLWIGIVNHMMFFTGINPAAWAFGVIFIIQGIVFLVSGTWRGNLVYGFRNSILWWVGTIFVAYAMIVYPILGTMTGHAWPYAPIFGVAPCPTTIFTFGLFLWTVRKFSNWILVIPFIWSLIGFSAALQLGVPEDNGLVIAGVIGSAMVFVRNMRMPTATEPLYEDRPIGQNIPEAESHKPPEPATHG